MTEAVNGLLSPRSAAQSSPVHPATQHSWPAVRRNSKT